MLFKKGILFKIGQLKAELLSFQDNDLGLSKACGVFFFFF